MKLSVEAKVAAAVAAAFVVLPAGAMAQGRGKGQAGGGNHFGTTNNSALNTRMSQQRGNSSLFGRTNADDRQNFSGESVISSGREQREERHEAREQRKERHEAWEERKDRHEAREQREDRHDAREQRQDRHEARRQRARRYHEEGTKDKSPSVKSPFEGSILEAKPANTNR
jgi:hypothetical protein